MFLTLLRKQEVAGGYVIKIVAGKHPEYLVVELNIRQGYIELRGSTSFVKGVLPYPQISHLLYAHLIHELGTNPRSVMIEVLERCTRGSFQFDKLRYDGTALTVAHDELKDFVAYERQKAVLPNLNRLPGDRLVFERFLVAFLKPFFWLFELKFGRRV